MANLIAKIFGSSWASMRRLVMMIVITGAGLGVSEIAQNGLDLRIDHLANSLIYGKCINALLAAGLFAATYGISRRELKRNARAVLVAVTFGVAFKAGVVGGVMVLTYGSAAYVLLGIAVAQVDPLSVAATLRHTHMSKRAQALLSAWASFDDPVTVLLVYAGISVLPLARMGASDGLTGAGGSYVSQLTLNVAFMAITAGLWLALRPSAFPVRSGRLRGVLRCLVLAALLVVAAWYGLLVDIAVCGLFFRPPGIEPMIGRAVDFAFYAAAFMLGLLLVGGVDVPAGLLLGICVFAAHALTSLVVGRGVPRRDRVQLALGQQNGLTAIALGLALEPYLPQAVGIIAIAILTVNVINICSNRTWGLKTARAPSDHSEDGSADRMPSPGGELVDASTGDRGTKWH